MIHFRHDKELSEFVIVGTAAGIAAAEGARAALIVLAAVFIVPLDKVALSVLGAVALNLVLAINHRSDRYTGVS